MKIKVTKPIEGDPIKKAKSKKKLPHQYGKYTGIRTEKGDIDNPTEDQAITNMVNYMKNNRSPASDNPSNVYRGEYGHIGIAYDRKKKSKNT